MADEKAIEIVHVDDHANANAVDQRNAGTDADEVAFTSDEFSIYVIVQTGQDARLTINFHNGDETVATMYVKKGAAATAQAYSLSLGCYLNALHPMP